MREITSFIFLSVVPPTYIADSPVNVIEGEANFRINVSLEANPIPPEGNFTWTFNGDELFLSSELDFGVDFIEFGLVSRDDNGTYEITGENLAGFGSETIDLNVLCKLEKGVFTATKQCVDAIPHVCWYQAVNYTTLLIA